MDPLNVLLLDDELSPPPPQADSNKAAAKEVQIATILIRLI
jgi:hypothetical protein